MIKVYYVKSDGKIHRHEVATSAVGDSLGKMEEQIFDLLYGEDWEIVDRAEPASNDGFISSEIH